MTFEHIRMPHKERKKPKVPVCPVCKRECRYLVQDPDEGLLCIDCLKILIIIQKKENKDKDKNRKK